LRYEGERHIFKINRERLDATFRQGWNDPVCRSETWVAGMYLLGFFYNFCNYHHSLRLKLSVGSFGHHWIQRTPAIAAQLTDHPWARAELFAFQVPRPFLGQIVVRQLVSCQSTKFI
jgi:hypothetical protein